MNNILYKDLIKTKKVDVKTLNEQSTCSKYMNCVCPKGFVCKSDYEALKIKDSSELSITNTKIQSDLKKLLKRQTCKYDRKLEECKCKDLNPFVLTKTKSEMEYFFGFTPGQFLKDNEIDYSKCKEILKNKEDELFKDFCDIDKVRFPY